MLFCFAVSTARLDLRKIFFSRIQCSVHFSFPLLSRVIHTKALFLYIFANICLSIKNHPCYEISY